ncbi:hypothetical protein EV702DRAFT_1048657 [Suillus placidus]|uniref:Uncharacterized protein n=1 Tax=Suillus placidus TaxID=48579 RepID=A0A9P6ZMH8_9AGAM|nr:hypothetical protein EV702DRAFT_1048657 [Suillus placidus]
MPRHKFMLVDFVLKFPEGHLSLVCAILGEADILTSQAICHAAKCIYQRQYLARSTIQRRALSEDVRVTSRSLRMVTSPKLCIKGELVHERTAILVSHRVQLCLTGTSYVVTLDDGLVTALPSPIIARQDGPTSISSLSLRNSCNETTVDLHSF